MDHFVKGFRQQYRKEIVFAGDAIRKMQEYAWPGNVRELQNFIERLMVLAPDKLIAAKDISLPRVRPVAPVPERAVPQKTIAAKSRLTLRELERDEIIRALEAAGGVQTAAAARLGITPRHLSYRIRKYEIARAGVAYE